MNRKWFDIIQGFLYEKEFIPFKYNPDIDQSKELYDLYSPSNELGMELMDKITFAYHRR